MSELNHSLLVIERALVKKEWIKETKNGNVASLGRVKNFFYRLRGENKRLEKISKVALSCLTELEREPIKFSHNTKVIQTQNYEKWLKTLHLLQGSLLQSKQAKVKQEIEWRSLSLKYRLEKVNGGIDALETADSSSFSELAERAEKWKKVSPHLEVQEVTQKEKEHLREVAIFPEQVKALLRSPDLLDEFMCWTIRDGNSAVPFFLFRGIQLKLKESLLADEIGPAIGNELKVVKKGDSNGFSQKILTLPFLLQNPSGKEEITPISLLDERVILNFPGNYKITLQKVFEAFKKKNKVVADFKCLSGALRRWHSRYWEYYDQSKGSFVKVNLERPDFYKEIPPLCSFSINEMREKYGLEVDGNKWIVELDATRENFDLDFNLVHAGLNFYIPNEKGGYDFHSFGKFPTSYPKNAWQLYLFLGKVVRGTILTPDSNPCHHKRQHAFYGIVVDPSIGLFGLDFIRKDKLEERKGNLFFQFISKGCASWAQNTMNEILKKAGQKEIKFFNTPIVKCEPKGGAGYLARFVRSLPVKVRRPMTYLTLLTLLPWRGKWVSANGKKMWFSLLQFMNKNSSFEIFNPARLHLRQLKGKFIPKRRLPAFLNKFKVG